MAIVLDGSKYHLTIDSKTIIGVMGKDYDKFLDSLVGDNVFYLDKKISISNKKVSSLFDTINDNISNIIKKFDLKEDFLNKKISELSHSEQKLLKYILLVLSNKRIIVIDEPYLDLDYRNKKRITLLINKLIKEKKTVIIGSIDSNIIYPLCKKILFINDNDYYYGDIKSFKDKELLNKYNISMPNLVQFVLLAKEKNINLRSSHDIRDLIKDVYRNVSQK